MDNDAAASRIRRSFSLADRIVEAGQTSEKLKAGAHLTVVACDFYGSYWLYASDGTEIEGVDPGNPSDLLREVLGWLRSETSTSSRDIEQEARERISDRRTTMSPRANFRRTMKRVEALLHLNKTLQGKGKPSVEIHDLLRAAVVLALGALDALVADLIAGAVPAAAKKGRIGDRVEGWVKEKPADFVRLLSDPDPHWLANLVREDGQLDASARRSNRGTLYAVLKLETQGRS